MGASRLVFGFRQQEVGHHYLLTILIAVSFGLIFFDSACDAAPLQRDISMGQAAFQESQSVSLRRTERSVTDYIKNLFSFGSGSSSDQPASTVRNNVRSSGSDRDSSNGGQSSHGQGTSNDNSNSDIDTNNDGSDNNNRPSSGNRARPPPPPVRDVNPSDSQSDGGQKSYTGNKWVDLVINTVSNRKSGENNGDSGSSGNSGGGVTSGIVDALAGAALKHILTSVLG